MVIETSLRYEQISPKAYEHPADRAATSVLKTIPMLETVIKKVIDVQYERRMREMVLASSIRLGPKQLPDIWNYYVQAGSILDLPTLPELYVYREADMNAMAVGANRPIVVLNSGMVAGFSVDDLQTVLAHETGHVLSEHYYYWVAAIQVLRAFLRGALPRNLFIGLPVTALYYALLEWHRAAELSADRAAALVRGDPLDVCRLMMRLAGGGVSGLNFETFLQQCTEYHAEDDLFTRHTRFWAEMRMTHPVSVRRVKELVEWVQSGEYDRIRSGVYPRRGQEPPPSAEFQAAVDSYKTKFSRFFDRTAGDVQRVGRQMGDWLRNRTGTGAAEEPDDEDESGE
jgi:Zn-dependent protease with chaperone function